jgi:hypothetical protein
LDGGSTPRRTRKKDASAICNLARKLDVFGLADKLIIFRQVEQLGDSPTEIEFLTITQAEGTRIFMRADLLLNFCYFLGPEILSRFRRTASVDIDPALLQFYKLMTS